MKSRPSITWTGVAIDCGDADAMARFYAEILGWSIGATDGAGWVQLRNPEGGVGLNIQADPAYEPPTWPEEPGRQQKMMHFEVLVDDLPAAVDLVERAGGRQAPWQPPDRDADRIRIMLDPAGHPFCLFVAGE